MRTIQKPRGLRNNNPLNIRIGNVWLGEVANPTDPDFEQFVSLKYGLRAAFCLLRRYIRHYKRDTIQSIIAAWAPAAENHTALYTQFVAARMELTPDTPLLYEDKATMCALVEAMTFYENGQTVELKTINESYDMA